MFLWSYDCKYDSCHPSYHKMPRSFFDPLDLALNDYVVVLCTRDENDPCYFEVPGTRDADVVWVARVKTCVDMGDGIYRLVGWFLQNDGRDLTQGLVERPKPEWIEFTQDALVGVYGYEEDFAVTPKNVKALAKYINERS